jgi:hypothetical protein
MCSAEDGGCSHPPGFPIRISPDHWLLAPPRSFSQLATSFFACSCQGIHTHALSSLTIKLTPYTESVPLALTSTFPWKRTLCYPSDIQLSKITKYFLPLQTRLNRGSSYAAPGITLRRPTGRRRSTEACAGRGNSLPYPEWRTAETSGRPVLAAIPGTYRDPYRSGVQRLPLTFRFLAVAAQKTRSRSRPAAEFSDCTHVLS